MSVVVAIKEKGKIYIGAEKWNKEVF